ncbi:MAG: glycoside hydrolase family 15 protein [Pseudomonadota bacterium]
MSSADLKKVIGTAGEEARLNHGVIGNGQVLALVAPTGALEWLCLPRFDSPSVFAAILDRDRGGSFGFEPVTDSPQTRMEYVRNTNVLRTEVRTSEGWFEIFDFAPRIPKGLTVEAPAEVHRLVVPREGAPRIRIHFDPKPDYGRARAELVPGNRCIEVGGGAARLFLQTNVPTTFILNGQSIPLDHPWYFVLSHGRLSEHDSFASVQHARDMTILGWRAWAKTCALPSFAASEVLRSALCLKLHVFEDTGAIIAATTTSIPEALGTERTWDYRYCWLRDAAFMVEALRRLSHLAEGEAFVRFLRNVAGEGELQPVYGIGGERMLPEERLEHLRGFGGTGPVRIGNAAFEQQQNDLMGEMVLCLETLFSDPRVVGDDTASTWRLVGRLVEKAIRRMPEMDTGPWEFRTLPRHYTFSKVLCWVAAYRGAELARHMGRTDQAERWEAWAAEVGPEILNRSYNERLGFFTQAFDGEHPDASNLLLPTFGIVDARDPRFIATVRAYEQRLVRNGLMLRYTHPDDFGETRSAFVICSFWWAEALAMMGELDAAVELFQRLLKYANPVGLFSEDIDPESGRLLGNFPQAYTHVGLIHAAITIGELLEARNAKFRAWT